MYIQYIRLPLDRFFVQVLLFAGHKVGSLDAGLHAGRNLAREDASKSVEATFVAGGHHLTDVHHQRTLFVAVFHG